MKTKKENPVLLLLKWAEKDRGFLIASVICAFLGGLLAIGPYIGIYRLMDAFFDRYLLYSGYFRKRGSNYGDGHYPASISRIIRHFFS